MAQRDERLAWIEAQTRECRRIALDYFGRALRVERKADDSPVTIADRAIETFLRRRLERAFPGEPIVGEEFGGSPTDGGSYWTLDPIDGTRAFSRGLPSWGILIGRVERGRPVLGACDYPAIDTFLGGGPRNPAYERRGKRRMPLSRSNSTTPLRDAVIFHGGSSWWTNTRYAEGFQRLTQACFLERAYGDCYGYLFAFRGHVDAVLDYGVKVWDMVPFAALAHATGRVMVDCAGRPSFRGPETILASAPLAHAIVKTLRPNHRG